MFNCLILKRGLIFASPSLIQKGDQMKASLLLDPSWSSTVSDCDNKKFDLSDDHHTSENSLWWESLPSLEEEEDLVDTCCKTDPMIQIKTPATFNSYGLSERFFGS